MHNSLLPGITSTHNPLPRPRIGITSRIQVLATSPHTVIRRPYIEAVFRAGGIPVILPILPGETHFPEWIGSLDALLLSGGEDINPLLFDQEPHPKLGRVDTVRDEWEIALTREWLDSGKPLMAVCRGIQTLQVAAGGTLIQDIHTCFPDAWRHEQRGLREDRAHTIEVFANTTLAQLLETKGSVEINSIHHQAVSTPAPGFRVSAKAGDGIIECIEADDGRCVFGVQWHPEEMTCPIQKRLFENFVRSVQNDITLRTNIPAST